MNLKNAFIIDVNELKEILQQCNDFIMADVDTTFYKGKKEAILELKQHIKPVDEVIKPLIEDAFNAGQKFIFSSAPNKKNFEQYYQTQYGKDEKE